MESCDVLIVGGGPAGSACAGRLTEAGLDVLVWDKARFPRDKPCAGWITLGVLETLGLDAASYGAARTLQPFHGFRTGQIGGRWPRPRNPLRRTCQLRDPPVRARPLPARTIAGTPARRSAAPAAQPQRRRLGGR
jgi:2-polyprenyl-6-methoxyphenol hydroxylase-like FAD-dependent oxidoreductase